MRQPEWNIADIPVVNLVRPIREVLLHHRIMFGAIHGDLSFRVQEIVSTERYSVCRCMAQIDLPNRERILSKWRDRALSEVDSQPARKRGPRETLPGRMVIKNRFRESASIEIPRADE